MILEVQEEEGHLACVWDGPSSSPQIPESKKHIPEQQNQSGAKLDI